MTNEAPAGDPPSTHPTKYSDFMPGERFAYTFRVEYPDMRVDLLVAALDEVIDVGSPQERVRRLRMLDRIRLRDAVWRVRARARRRRHALADPTLQDLRALRSWRRAAVRDLMSRSPDANPVAALAARASRGRALLSRLIKISGEEEHDVRVRRLALVAAAILMQVAPDLRPRFGGAVLRLAGREVEFDDLVPFVSWVVSGEPIAQGAARCAQALALARGSDSKAALEAASIDPEEPRPGTHAEAVLQKLRDAPAGEYVPESELHEGNPRDTIGQLRKMGYRVETAPPLDPSAGYRLSRA